MPTPARARKPQIETLSLEERVRRRAYELYVQRGNQSGSELDDWLQAEEEIQIAKSARAHFQQRKETTMPDEITSKLADAKINITSVQAFCAGSGRYGGMLWVKAADMRKAAKALGVGAASSGSASSDLATRL